MSFFDERSGIVECKTDWGCWWQTCEEVFVTVNVSKGTNSKDIKCVFKPKQMSVTVHGVKIIEGQFAVPIQASDVVWTLEDKTVLQICLPKSFTTADSCWRSLLVDQYIADPFTFDNMQKKLTLQRFQLENPGLDFSGAELTGNYHNGGPCLP